MKIVINEIPEEIEFIRDGKLISRWHKASGSWSSFTDKVKMDGNWSRFLLFESEMGDLK